MRLFLKVKKIYSYDPEGKVSDSEADAVMNKLTALIEELSAKRQGVFEILDNGDNALFFKHNTALHARVRMDDDVSGRRLIIRTAYQNEAEKKPTTSVKSYDAVSAGASALPAGFDDKGRHIF